MRSLLQILALSILSLPLIVSGVPTPDGDSEVVPRRINLPRGIDVSNDQGSIDWSKVKADGNQFAYIKATEGTISVDPAFSSNYAGAASNGIIRGAYHLAHLGDSPGAVQATFFLANGGGWTGDGRTLPGALYLEGDCPPGLSLEGVGLWIHEFSDTYEGVAGRLPVIYTSTKWWTECTGDSYDFADNPLWFAKRGTAFRSSLPENWRRPTFFQFDNSGTDPGNQDYFVGDDNELQGFASSD